MPTKEKDYYRQVILKDLSQHSLVYLVPLSDFHIGVKNPPLGKIQGYIDWIKNRPNAFTILNGDMINGATKDTSAELYDDLITPDQAYDQVLELLLPIRHRVLMVTRGNHEETIYRKVGADYTARLARDLGDVPYKPDGGMVGVRLGLNNHTAMCWMYAVHGWGGARTIGAKVKKAQDLSLVANVHIYILSHDHTENLNRGNIMEPPRAMINFNKPCYWTIGRRLYVNTGGFIPYTGYVQRKGYTPQDLGTPRIRIEFKESKREGYHLDLHASI